MFIFLCRDISKWLIIRIGMQNFSVSGQIVDVVSGRVYPGIVTVIDGYITSVVEDPGIFGPLIIPGLIDSHIHIESSMMVPSEFARIAVVHGTTSVVSDPHEIANVMGIEGVRFMIENGKKVPFNFYFGAPSCVPATSFESTGAVIGPEEIAELLSWKEINYLSEMMNYPGVLTSDKDVISKIEYAKTFNKPIDGHAPGLKGEDVQKYANAGISTDHECFSKEEALVKIENGIKILIREGSAARNFNELISLISDFPEMIMFCSDDKHPDDLLIGHINLLVKRAIDAGYNFMDVIRACTLNPIIHYKLDAGLLQEGDRADFILVDNANSFNVLSTYVGGELVASDGILRIEKVQVEPFNVFNAAPINIDDLKVEVQEGKLKVIRAFSDQLITSTFLADPKIENGYVVSDVDNDILKLVVLNRYKPEKPAIAFITGFNLKQGALASTVAHDSHNIIAVGTDDSSIIHAIDLLRKNGGGISLYANEKDYSLSLPIAGLMSNEDGDKIALTYQTINKAAKEAGSNLEAPFMTLSFMSLLVIPELKLSDKGIFDSANFKFTELFDKY